MSKFVDEIILDLKKHPYNWVMIDTDVIRNDKVKLTDEWPSILKWYLPFIECKINGIEMKLTYIDRVKLSYAMRNWQKEISLKHLELENEYTDDND